MICFKKNILVKGSLEKRYGCKWFAWINDIVVKYFIEKRFDCKWFAFKWNGLKPHLERSNLYMQFLELARSFFLKLSRVDAP